MDLGTDLDALFRLPLAQFTTARNELAGRLQKAGLKADAARVRAIAKPPVSAWAVNQLFWRSRDSFDRLIQAGARLRQAQAAGLAGRSTNVVEPLQAQREALNELAKQAVAFLSEGGHAANPETLRRVTLDLQGLAARGPSADGPHPGRLTDDVAAPGFDTFAALVPQMTEGSRPTGSSSRVISFPHSSGRTERPRRVDDPASVRAREQARRAEARKAVTLAQRALAAAQRDAEKAEAAMKQAATALKVAEREKQKAEAAVEKIAAKADAARHAARRTAGAAADAAQAVDEAERALAQARAKLP